MLLFMLIRIQILVKANCLLAGKNGWMKSLADISTLIMHKARPSGSYLATQGLPRQQKQPRVSGHLFGWLVLIVEIILSKKRCQN